MASSLLLVATFLGICTSALANPPLCECTGDNSALKQDELKHHGANYGKWCAAWDDGICSNRQEPGLHTCGDELLGAAISCDEHWPDLNFNRDQIQCCDSWCYVNRQTCTDSVAREYGITVEQSWITSKRPDDEQLYFSYGACPDWNTRSKYPPDGALDYSQYSMEECPYREYPIGCNCVGENLLLGVGELANHGWDYGKWCAPWEDDMCTPNATAADRPKHTCNGTAQSCLQHWPTIDKFANQLWCCDAWCYVNNTCDKKLHRLDVKDSWVSPQLKYSYAVCSDWSTKPTPIRGKKGWLADLAQYSEDSCPERVALRGCECSGDNSLMAEGTKLLLGDSYGTWCAAWEDGMCAANPTDWAFGNSHVNGRAAHPCEGTAKKCEDMWPDGWDFNQPQTWCCDAWCYVDPTTCTPELQEYYGIQLQESWATPGLFYSYHACATPYTRPKVPAHGIVNYAQLDDSSCKYASGFSWTVKEIDRQPLDKDQHEEEQMIYAGGEPLSPDGLPIGNETSAATHTALLRLSTVHILLGLSLAICRLLSG